MGESCQHMKMETANVLRFLSSETIFNIPNYQPAYAWSAEQCKQLFFDLEDNWKNKTTTCLGMLVYTEKKHKPMYTYNITDQHQIMINCMLLLKSLVDVYPNFKTEIEKRYLSNPYINTKTHLKLMPVTQDKHDFDMIMASLVDQVAETSLLLKNFNYYKTLIRKSKLESRQLYEALNTLNVTVINVNPQENESPQSLLDTINLTSDNLNDADKILNFILMHTKEKQKEQFYNDYWLKIKALVSNRNTSMMDFLRDYLALSSGNSIVINKLYSTYRYYYKQNHLTPETALEDLYSMAALDNDVPVEKKAKRKYEHKDYSDNVLSPDEHYITEDIDVTNYYITQLNIDGNKINVNHWKRALVKFLNFLFEMDKNNRELIRENKRLNKTIFKTYDDDRTCYLDNGELVYAHLSAKDSLRRMKELSKACHMDDVVTFKVIPKDKK
jgi:uncharacterized protein with ParB-like and HNH nuclease domain